MANGIVKTYAAKEVTISMGRHMASGVADDSFVSIEPAGDGITYKYGCDGEIARAVSPNDTYIVKLTTLQTSDTNSFLQNQFNIDMASQTANALFPISSTDAGIVISFKLLHPLKASCPTLVTFPPILTLDSEPHSLKA